MLEEIAKQTETAIHALLDSVQLINNDMVVIGCSSSAVAGHPIGMKSSLEIGQAIFGSIHPLLEKRGLLLAAQCCEHLNRALIVEREASDYYGLEQVNAVPVQKAGGSFATAAFQGMRFPVAVEGIAASCGIDIGLTLIGMHLKQVVVPLELSPNKIGEARVVYAKTRAKYIGGQRTVYNEKLQ